MECRLLCSLGRLLGSCVLGNADLEGGGIGKWTLRRRVKGKHEEGRQNFVLA